MKRRWLLFGAVAQAATAQEFIPTQDFIECRVNKNRDCTLEDFGGEPNLVGPGVRRWSDYSVRDIYHDVFTYKGGVMYVERPIKVVENWRIPGLSTVETLPDGRKKTCRDTACIIEAKPEAKQDLQKIVNEQQRTIKIVLDIVRNLTTRVTELEKKSQLR